MHQPLRIAQKIAAFEKTNMTHPKPPKHLTSESKKLWRSLHESYELDDAARLVLVATLESRDRRVEAREEIAKGGATQVDRFGQRKPSPWIAIERDAAMTMMRGFRLLGFDQEARAEGRR